MSIARISLLKYTSLEDDIFRHSRKDGTRTGIRHIFVQDILLKPEQHKITKNHQEVAALLRPSWRLQLLFSGKDAVDFMTCQNLGEIF